MWCRHCDWWVRAGEGEVMEGMVTWGDGVERLVRAVPVQRCTVRLQSGGITRCRGGRAAPSSDPRGSPSGRGGWRGGAEGGGVRGREVVAERRGGCWRG